MSAELEVLQDAIGRLEGAGIAYMLTGSVALSYYAEPRMTRDIDLVVELAGRDPHSIVALFATDYYVSEADVARAIAARKEDLILSKLAWAKESGSELQLRDVRMLLAAGADEAYLRGCAEELSVAALLETCLHGRHDA